MASPAARERTSQERDRSHAGANESTDENSRDGLKAFLTSQLVDRWDDLWVEEPRSINHMTDRFTQTGNLEGSTPGMDAGW